MIYITSYINPDLDGIACALSYQDYLQKLNQASQVVYTGDLDLETKYLSGQCGHLSLIPDTGVYPPDSTIVLVDIADPKNINPNISLDKVIRVFDHHLRFFPEKFPNAQIIIDKVGACATLLAEFLQYQKHTPSQDSAKLLYGAIVSGTVNFQNSVTTNRDKQACKWLSSIVDIPEDFVKNMFRSKSIIDKHNLYEVINQTFAVKNISGKNIGISQIEIADLEKLVSNLKPQLLDILKKLKAEKNLDYLLFSGIDILLGFNYLIVIDLESGELFSKVLSVPLFTSEFKTDNIIMRKQIWPLLDTALNSTSVLKLSPK